MASVHPVTVWRTLYTTSKLLQLTGLRVNDTAAKISYLQSSVETCDAQNQGKYSNTWGGGAKFYEV